MLSISASLLLVAVGAPSTVHADVRLQGQTRYTLVKTHTPKGRGRVQIRSVYRDRRGGTALVMEADVVGGRPVEVRADNRQDGLRATVKISAGKVAFERHSDGGEDDTSTSEALGVVLVGPELSDYIQSDEAWRRLERGERVPIRIAAWRKMDTYAFELKRLRETESELTVRMQPSSWMVRAFVDEMVYTFDRHSRRLLRYHGPVGVECKDEDGDLAPLVADVVYAYPSEVTASVR